MSAIKATMENVAIASSKAREIREARAIAIHAQEGIEP